MNKQGAACPCGKDKVELTCLDWRAVRPVYMLAVKRQRAAMELIVTEETAVAAKTRMGL